MKKVIGILIILCFTGSVAAKDIYLVSANIHNNDTLLGSPKLGVEPAKQAIVSVSNAYDFTVVVHEKSESTVIISINLQLKGEEHNPVMEVALGKEASITTGDTKLSVLVTKSST